MSRARGFSLAEAMVAIAILALIGALTYGTFARAMDARDRAERITSHYHQTRQAMLRMAREISMAFLSRHKECGDPRSDTMFVSGREQGSARLDFTSFSHVKTNKDANESDQNVLSYYLERDSTSAGATGLLLMRREKARIDERPKDDGVAQVLAPGIDELAFQFYDAKQDRWEDEWDSQSSEYRYRLPLFVRIEIKAKDLNGKQETFVTKTRIFLQKPILILGTGFTAAADGC